MKVDLALRVSMALFAPILVGTCAAQSAAWTATSAPVQSTIAGGPWTLGQGGSSTSGGAYDGPIPYCTPGNSAGGTELVNSSSTVNTFNPYYFPFVVGSGQSVKGYFDYRPKNINEAIVAATSTNAGQTWTFQQMAEQLTTECPNSDANTANQRRQRRRRRPSQHHQLRRDDLALYPGPAHASCRFRWPDRPQHSAARRERAEPSSSQQPVHATARRPISSPAGTLITTTNSGGVQPEPRALNRRRHRDSAGDDQ